MNCSGTSLNYIGSTSNFSRRKWEHKSNIENNNTIKLYQYVRFYNIKSDDIVFEVLAEIDTNIHLKLEQMFIDQFDSIKNGQNTIRSHRTEEERIEQETKAKHKWEEENYQEYYQFNKDKILEKRKQYRSNNPEKMKEQYEKHKEKHKEKRKEKRKEIVKCNICNISLTRGCLTRHIKRKH
jgi:hypothetical protein